MPLPTAAIKKGFNFFSRRGAGALPADSALRSGAALMGLGAVSYMGGRLIGLPEELSESTEAIKTASPAGRARMAKATGIGAVSGGLAVGAASALLFRRPSGAVLGMMAGAYSGGLAGWKLAAGTARAISQGGRMYFGLSKRPKQPRAYGFGPGYRTWYKRPGGKLQPGHMGADGGLTLALHKTRNRSIRRT